MARGGDESEMVSSCGAFVIKLLLKLRSNPYMASLTLTESHSANPLWELRRK